MQQGWSSNVAIKVEDNRGELQQQCFVLSFDLKLFQIEWDVTNVNACA